LRQRHTSGLRHRPEFGGDNVESNGPFGLMTGNPYIVPLFGIAAAWLATVILSGELFRQMQTDVRRIRQIHRRHYP
jgi:hypothetical protein